MAQDKEVEAFRAMMLSQFARLAENAGRYIGRMCNEDRECILWNALISAWMHRREYNPVATQLAKYWDDCLREAITCRGSFQSIALRRTADWEIVSSKEVLTGIQPIGVPSNE